VFTGGEEDDCEFDGEEEEAGDDEVGDFAALTGGAIERVEDAHCGEPTEEDGGAPDDGIGPGDVGGFIGVADSVHNHAGHQAEPDHGARDDEHALGKDLEPFERGEFEAFLGRDFSAQAIGLHEIHQAADEADGDGGCAN
jgi:hypothetical protein